MEIDLQEARQLPAGSVIALPREGRGFSGAFVITTPGMVSRYGQPAKYSLPIEDWISAEMSDQIHLVWLGKGDPPSKTTLRKHWDRWAEDWWRPFRAREIHENPAGTFVADLEAAVINGEMDLAHAEDVLGLIENGCPAGELQIRRKGYTRKPYTRKDGTRVKRTRVPPTTFCAPDRGAKGRGPKVVTLKEGGLGGPGYLSKSASERHKILRRCVKRDGYRTCLGRIQALSVLGKREFSKSDKKKLVQDRKWLVKEFGGPGSFGPRKRNGTNEFYGDAYVAIRVRPGQVDVASVSLDDRIAQSTDSYLMLAAERETPEIIDENLYDVPVPPGWGSMSFTAEADDVQSLIRVLREEASAMPWVGGVFVGENKWPSPPRRSTNPGIERKLKVR